jgi:hypothetical protein
MDTSNCPNCKKGLKPWTKFKDLKMKEGIGLAICGSVINGLDHFWSGEYRSSKKKPNYRTTALFFCESCKSYYLQCPGCRTLVNLSTMPDETKTMAQCTRCGKSILYAEEDYSLGG